MQLDGRGRRVRGLYHRQRRQQSDRPAGLGRGRRHARAGLEFLFLRALNLAGAVLVYFTIQRVPADACDADGAIAVRGDDRRIWRNPALRAAFAIGFCILFAFIGTFTFVNFVLVRPPLSLGRMDLGFVYFVFAALRRHDAVRRPRGGALRHAADDLGRAGGRGVRACRCCCRRICLPC